MGGDAMKECAPGLPVSRHGGFELSEALQL